MFVVTPEWCLLYKSFGNLLLNSSFPILSPQYLNVNIIYNLPKRSMYFLTHVEPVNLQQGTDTRFFVREQSPAGNRSHVAMRNISHYFFTPPLLHDDASALMEKLKKSIPDTMLLEEKKYNSGRSFVRVTGSKENASLLPALFHPKNEPVNSPSRQLRWIYSPMLLLESPDKIPAPVNPST